DNNLVTETDPRGNATAYAYDANGNTIAVGQPQVTVNTPGGLATFRPTSLYDYDSSNNIVAYCDARATHAAGHDWPNIGAPQSDTLCTSGAGGTPHETFGFTTPCYQLFGELATIRSPLGYSRYIGYDMALQGGNDYGLPTSVSGDIIAQADGTSRQPYQRLTYDINGNVICAAANANDATSVHSMTYDALNRLIALADPDDAS